jgi:hypothetical protein
MSQPAPAEGAPADPGAKQDQVHPKALSVVSLGGVAESGGVGEGNEEGPEWEYAFAVGEHAAAVFVHVKKI